MNVALKGSNEVPSCHGGLENLDEEYDYLIDDIEGEVPTDLSGTFLRNGPGRQKIGGTPYGHWFDGDGMLSAFSFNDGKVHFRNRYVRTPKYLEETEKQKILYRGFGTQIPGGFWKNAFKFPANPANTNVVYHGGRMLALNEGGRPWEVDPTTLETRGEYDYDGVLRGKTFSAHGKIHQETGDYINFGAGTTGKGISRRPCLNIYRINPVGTVTNTGQLLLDRFPFCHDYALGSKHAIFFINSIIFEGMGGFFLGTRRMSDLIRFAETSPMKILVVDLDTLEVVREFESGAGAIIHFGNAFERGDEIVVDAMFTDNFDANETLGDVFNPNGRFGGGVYRRYVLNLRTGQLDFERMSDTESEFPTFNTAVAGKAHSVTYTACSVPNGADSFFNGIQKVTFDGDATLVTLPAGHYGSEPLFAPARDARAEADGYVLEVVYDAFKHRSDLQIYRADTFELISKLHLRHHLPHQFHGFFSPDTQLEASVS